MECSLAALALCFSWSNIYMDGGLQYTDTEMYEMDLVTRKAVAHRTNPLGAAAFGYEVDFDRKWRISLDVRHTSSLDTGKDRGVNVVGLNVRYFPLR